jgi:hypothetical protein
MIAPIREPNTAAPPRRLGEARHYLSTTLFDRTVEAHGSAVASWKAWALVGWMMVVSLCYGASMLGWW